MENYGSQAEIVLRVIYFIVALICICGFIIYLLINQFKSREKLAKIEEKHLKDLLDKHLETQEHERERIGSDLHDSISNKLNIILLKLRLNANKDDIEQELNDAIHAVRRISHDLNPPLIEIMPLDAIVFSQFDKLSENFLLTKWSQLNHQQAWNSHVKIQLTRIIQELINNIIRHSKASEVQILIRNSSKSIFIKINDNGIGMNCDSNGMGMKNIQNRLFIIGGKIKFKSEQNKGTTVLIALNYEPTTYNS